LERTVGNKFFENLTEFRYLGTSLTNQIAFVRKLMADEIRECLLPVGFH